MSSSQLATYSRSLCTHADHELLLSCDWHQWCTSGINCKNQERTVCLATLLETFNYCRSLNNFVSLYSVVVAASASETGGRHKLLLDTSVQWPRAVRSGVQAVVRTYRVAGCQKGNKVFYCYCCICDCCFCSSYTITANVATLTVLSLCVDNVFAACNLQFGVCQCVAKCNTACNMACASPASASASSVLFSIVVGQQMVF